MKLEYFELIKNVLTARGVGPYLDDHFGKTRCLDDFGFGIVTGVCSDGGLTLFDDHKRADSVFKDAVRRAVDSADTDTFPATGELPENHDNPLLFTLVYRDGVMSEFRVWSELTDNDIKAELRSLYELEQYCDDW